MVDKLLQSLKTKYAHLGLEESILKAIATRLATAVKEESEIENAVKGVEEEVKLLQSVADKGRTSLSKAEESRKKLEKELEEIGLNLIQILKIHLLHPQSPSQTKCQRGQKMSWKLLLSKGKPLQPFKPKSNNKMLRNVF